MPEITFTAEADEDEDVSLDEATDELHRTLEQVAMEAPEGWSFDWQKIEVTAEVDWPRDER